MSCEQACMLVGKALDALTAEDVKRATKLTKHALLVCEGACDNPRLCRAIDLALDAFLDSDIELATTMLNGAQGICQGQGYSPFLKAEKVDTDQTRGSWYILVGIGGSIPPTAIR